MWEQPLMFYTYTLLSEYLV